MWQIIPVEYSRASIGCDRHYCTNKIMLNAIPADYCAELHELEKVRELAERRGWHVDSNSLRVTCHDHTPNNKEENQ